MRGKKKKKGPRGFFNVKAATVLRLYMLLLKGTVMQIKKALTNDCLGVSKVPWKFCIVTICIFSVIYP